MTSVETVRERGWELARLRSELLEVDVVPGKGGDILGVRWLPLELDLLWRTPWGLRPQGAVPSAGGSVEALMEAYPGGWQTVFPNAGDPVEQHGTTWGMHGEAWLAAYDRTDVDGGVELRTRLVRSPFSLTKRITLDGNRLTVVETATNDGGVPVDAMWGHHPAFGAPFLSASCRVETAARTFLVDDARETAAGDLAVGASGPWPQVPTRSGGSVDVSAIPAAGSGTDRFGYLTDLDRGWVALVNDELRVRADLEWDTSVLPYAWFWLEANATPGFPWYQAAYVLGLEPASSIPGQGLVAAAAKTGTQLTFAPGESRTATVSLTVSATDR